MAETHELRLKIDASDAKRGSRDFTSAISAVKAAVKDLDREADGTFRKLARQKPQFDVTPLTRARSEATALATATDRVTSSTDRAADNIRKMAIQSANALRVSTDQASRLRDRLLSVGDTAGLSRLEAGLDNLRSSLISATSGLDVREARAGYSDLASELNRTAREAERLNAINIAAARAEQDAAAAAANRATTLDNLRAKHDSLFRVSRQYEVALREIQQLEDAGAMSAVSAAAARDRAAASMAGTTSAVHGFAVSAGQAQAAAQQMGYQVNDVITMAAMGASPMQVISSQIFQISQAMDLAGGKAQALSSVKTALLGLLNPSTLAVGAVIGLTTALVQWGVSAIGAGEKVKTFNDSLSDADSRISSLREATDALAGRSVSRLREEYGRLNSELDAHLERLRKVAALEAAMSNAEMIAGIRDALTSDGNPFTGDVDAVRRAFDTTNDRARQLLRLMEQVKAAKTFEEQAAAVTRLREEVERTSGGLDKAEGAGAKVLGQLIRAEDAALRLKAAQDGTTAAMDNATGAASSLTYNLGTAADEAARLLQNLGSVPSALAVMGKSVADQISSIQAQNASLGIQLSEGWTSAAANRRVQLDTIVKHASTTGLPINVDQVATEYKQIEELERLGKEQEALRKRLSDANAPARKARTGGGGSSRKEQLTDEQKALESLNDTLKDRLTSLDEERRVIGLVASDMFQTEEAAQLYAKAQTAVGGNVDEATANMIRQIDAAQKLNEALTEAARDPLKEWQDTVPSYQKIGNDIEAALISSVQQGMEDLMTGDFTWENFGNRILSDIAGIAAPKATEELFALTGLDQLIGGVGDWTAGLGGDSAQIASGGAQAGQTISAAMVQAGLQVSQQISAAMTTGGTSAQSAMQSGMIAGGSQAAQQQRLAGIATGQQVRTASAQGGQSLAQGVVSGSQQGAPILGAAVASGGATGGAGGNILSAMGGWGGIATAVLGAFEEGGISTAPVGTASMPLSAFHNAPHFAQGTANTSGIPAVLHPNEAVIPLSKGRKVPVEMGGESVGGRVFNQTINQTITTPDADSFRKSKRQIANEFHRAGASAHRSLS